MAWRQVVAVLLASCRADGFAHVPSFRWLVATLFTVASLKSKHGVEVARLLHEVTLRVPAVRTYAVELSLETLLRLGDEGLPLPEAIPARSAAAARGTAVVLGATKASSALGSAEAATEAAMGVATDASLLAASYILTEHSYLLPAKRQRAALEILLSKHVVLLLSADVQASCVLAALRVLMRMPAADTATNYDSVSALGSLLAVMRPALASFCTSIHPEVVERARAAYALASLLGARGDVDGANLVGGAHAEVHVRLLFALRSGLVDDLRAVALKAQKKVKPLASLDLQTPIHTPSTIDCCALPSPDHKGGASDHNEGAASAVAATQAAGAMAPTEEAAGGSALQARRHNSSVLAYYLQPRSCVEQQVGADLQRGVGRIAATGDNVGLSAATKMLSAAGSGPFGDESDGASVDLDEAMPDHAEASDPEEGIGSENAAATQLRSHGPQAQPKPRRRRRSRHAASASASSERQEG